MTDDNHAGGDGGAHGRLTYLQIPATDATTSTAFYQSVFGWRIDGTTSFEAPGLIGQWVADRPPAHHNGLLAWFNVDDLDKALSLVAAHGGSMVDPPSADGPTRMLATVLDPGGNLLGLVQHSPAT